MTIDIDWRAAWIAEQEHRGRSDDATRWDERSANYAKVSGTSSYASTFLDYAGVELNTPALEEERDGLMPPWKYEASYD